jgi:PAS domain S-box-containing protein
MANLVQHTAPEETPISPRTGQTAPFQSAPPEQAAGYSAHEGIWITNAELATTFVNSRMTALLGYRSNEMMGRPIADFVDPASRTAINAMLERLPDSIAGQTEVCLLRRDGAPLFAVVDLRALFTTGTEFRGVRASIIDVTAQRVAEVRVKDLEGQLQLAEQMARLTASMAHELNNILRGIQSFAEMILRDNTGDARTYAWAVRITDAASRGTRVTHEILESTQLHEGELSVDSSLGAGSTNHVLVPPAAEDPAPPGPLEVACMPGEPLRRLLLVEDDPGVALGLATLLEMDEIDVALVTRGAEAVARIEAFCPDAVVLDVGLPDISGITVYELIARRWPSLPVLFSTGSGDEKLLTHVLTRPNVGYLQKPYDGESLIRALGKLRGR